MDPEASEKKQVRVSIFNQTYSLSTSEDPALLEDLAQTVDALMLEIALKAGNLDATRTAVLACLHLADRLRTLENELADLRRRVDRKSKQFSVLLDQVIQTD